MKDPTMTKDKSHIQYRNDKSGQYVPNDWGKQHKERTTREHVPNPGRGDTGPSKGGGKKR
jgi:hypothetical protein